MARSHRLLAAAFVLVVHAGCRDDAPPVPKVGVEPINHADAGSAPVHPEPNSPGGELDPAPTPPVPVGPVQEIEPNDRRETASPLPINAGLRATLAQGDQQSERGGNDVDWYVLTLPGTQPQQVRIQLGPEDNSDYVLQWMPANSGDNVTAENPDGVLAFVDNGKAGGVEVLPPMILVPGRHYFRVVAAERRRDRGQVDLPDRPYRLTTTIVDPEPQLEAEPNGTREEATVLLPGEPREGYLGWFRDVDWYRLDLSDVPPDALLRIDVSEVPGVKTRLWVVDRERNSLVKVPEPAVPWSPGRAVCARDIGLTANAGPYYVEVRSLRAGNPSDRYTIRLQADPPQTLHEREPNWRPSEGTATLLAPNAPVDGFIGHPTDWDTYQIKSETPSLATVVISGVPNVDLELELIDDKRSVLGSVNEVEHNSPENYPLIAVGPGHVFIRVRSKDHTYNTEQGYRIAVTLSEAGDTEIEPNNEFGDAARVILPPQTPFKGHVHPRGDVDYYALDIAADGPDESQILTLRLTGVEGLTLSMELFDQEQALITRKRGIGSGETRTITHGFTAGRYYVRIVDESSQAANGQDAYVLELSD